MYDHDDVDDDDDDGIMKRNRYSVLAACQRHNPRIPPSVGV